MPFVLLASGAPFFADEEDMAAIRSGKIPLDRLWQGPLPQQFTGPGGNDVKPLTAADFPRAAPGVDPSGLDVGAELGGGPTPQPTNIQGIPTSGGGGLLQQTQPGVPPGEIATTGEAGQVDPQLQALQLITTQFNAGRFANMDEVVTEIGRVLGIDRNQALNFLEVIRPDFTRSVEDTTPSDRPPQQITPTPQVTPTPRPGPEAIGGGGDIGPQTRANLFAEQGGDELRRRLIADQFGANLSPLAGRAASSALNRFTGLDPLLEFASPEQTLGQRFAGFAGGGRPTGADIGSQLDLLGGAGGAGPSGAFLDFVPDFETAARLGAQETLAGVNPRLARRAESRFLSDFATERAQRPEQFQTVDAASLAAQLQATRDRFQGFFR